MELKFQLVKIDVPQFAIINDGEFSNPLQINFENNFAIDDNVTSIKNTLKVIFLNSGDAVMQVVVECYYAVSKESWEEMKNSDNSLTVPADFLQHLSMITIGTTRGILHARTADTNLNQYVLPLVNVTEMVNKDLRINPHLSKMPE